MKQKTIKKKMIVLSGLFILVTAAGAWGIPSITERITEAKRWSALQSAYPELASVAKAVDAAAANEPQQSRQLMRYVDWVKVYHPTQEQQQEISQMIADGADVDVLLDICRFWEDTNEPFSLIAQIYEARPEDEILAEFHDHFLWITSAYDRIKGKENEALSPEDVLAYQEQGVSTTDVYVADRMSRGGADIRTVLENRAEGQSWQEIILPDDSRAAAFGIRSDENEIDGNDLLDSLILSRRTGLPASDFLEAAQQKEESVLETYRQEQTADMLNELHDLGLLPAERSAAQ